ncbi:MAG: type II toxin-antitoxin system HicB family antitoxin [Gemmatimonadetes bacterium]|nr:type II toxin-antitoxin system HicB family antitoxin [Gemmatimonadota bacterium]
MLKYPVILERDDNTVLVTSPDFPELNTFGMDREEAIARATDAMEEAIAARIHDGLDIPLPSKGRDVTVLPTLTAVKVMLYRGMKEQGVGKAELARRLGWHLPQVDRVLDVQHNSRMDQMDAAMGAIGRHLVVRDSLR